jgi:hypothetical protein
MKSNFPYRGALATPIVAPNRLAIGLGLLGHSAEEAAAADLQADLEIRKQREVKFELLGAAFGIKADDPDFWEHLAITLAFLHVPGMRLKDNTKRGRGAPKVNYFPLYAAVEGLKNDGHTVAGACLILSKRKGTAWHQRTPRTLETRYHEVAKKLRTLWQR